MDGEAMYEKRTAEHRIICGLVAKLCFEESCGAQGEYLCPDGEAMP